jgi:hypothetical protein
MRLLAATVGYNHSLPQLVVSSADNNCRHRSHATHDGTYHPPEDGHFRLTKRFDDRPPRPLTTRDGLERSTLGRGHRAAEPVPAHVRRGTDPKTATSTDASASSTSMQRSRAPGHAPQRRASL